MLSAHCPVLTRRMATRIILRALTASILLLCPVPTAVAKDTQYIYGTSIDGITKQLAVDRTPALYTGNFGDCMGGQSLLNITKFDAAVSLNPDREVSYPWVSERNTTSCFNARLSAHSKFMKPQGSLEKEC